MLASSTELTPEITLDDFFTHYWRRRPLFMPGAARRFVDPPLTEQEAETAIGLARRSGTDRLSSDPGRTDFLRGADREVPRLAAIAARLQHEFGLPGLGFDIVQTHTGGGIGSHFDDTDNFIVQHTGSKLWRIGPVETLPEDDHRRRLLRHTGYDWTAFLPHPEDVEEFVLKPGDVLYVPLYAPHCGTADGPSVSSPLVCGVDTALEDLLPIVEARLASDPNWWGPTPLTGRLPGVEDVSRLLSVLTGPDFVRDVAARWQADRLEAIAGHRRKRPAPDNRAEPPLGRKLVLDIAPLKPLFAQRPGPDLRGVVAAEPAALESLDALVSTRNCKRLLVLAAHRFERLGDAAAADSAQQILAMLAELPPTQVARFVRGAEITGWLGLAEREHVANYRRTPDLLLGWLMALVLAERLAAGPALEALAVDFPALSSQLRKRITAEAAAAGFHVAVEASTLRLTPVPATAPHCKAETGEEPHLPTLVTAESWLHSLLPQRLLAHHDPDHARDTVAAVSAAAREIAERWPASRATFSAALSAVVPIGAGAAEKCRPVRELRGLVVAPHGLRGEEAQIGLWKAAASTRFSDLAGLCRLVEDPGVHLRLAGHETSVPVIDLLHQGFVSAWLTHLPEDLRSHACVSLVDVADVEALRETAGLTEIGRALVVEILKVLAPVGTVKTGL
ncbi:MAG: sle [Actinomycetia bacterium]|nr:sle [Actinomycetes bacterium]